MLVQSRYEHTFPFETNNFDLDSLDEGNFRLLFKCKLKALKQLVEQGGKIGEKLSPSEEKLRMLEKSDETQAQTILELKKQIQELTEALRQNGGGGLNHEEVKQLREENSILEQRIKEMQKKQQDLE